MYSPSVCFLFTIFFISIITTKLLHLTLNAHSFPTAVFAFCLPAFLVPDVILISTVWFLLRRKKGLFSILGFCLGCLISLVTLGAASSQLGFFYRTGGEIDWGDASSFAQSEDARKVLLSEGIAPLSFTCVILVVSWIIKFRLYKLVSAVSAIIEAYASSVIRRSAARIGFRQETKGETESSLLPTQEYSTDYESDSDYDFSAQSASPQRSKEGNGTSSRAMRFPRFILVTLGAMVLVSFVSIWTLFDPERPYSRMFITLPITLLAAFAPEPNVCAVTSWPLLDVIGRSKWESPHGNFKGWAPGSANDIIKQYRERRPDWLPDNLPDGFTRWGANASAFGGVDSFSTTDDRHHKDDNCPDPLVFDPYYNPANDPMKITNLDVPMFGTLEKMLAENSVTIKHIVLIQMESMREELFPLQQGSDFHKLMMKFHNEADHDEINELFSHISPNAERITGRPGKWMSDNGTTFGPEYSEWNDTTENGFGGINVIGGLTPSSVSTKSLAAIHCGAWPMPVDMLEEAETESYQPCIPEVLELFNRMKANTSSPDYQEQQWYPAFFQSVTDGYDRQDVFDTKIGFKHIVNKNTIKKDAAGDPKLEEINYFGFPETALKKYVNKYIADAKENNQRIFMTHFTSTTHHPWATPKWFDRSEYFHSAHELLRTHEDLNSYLNTIRFTDAWIGQLMQILDDQGISNETLVVFVGDHGQAFKEDVSKTGTYENGHISNFRIPITFRHPRLPRVQHRVNATSISILPTILDLLVTTGSLNQRDTAAAADLVQDYEGQSLIRPWKTSYKGRRAWNYGLVNPGGRLLTITSADTPWRLVLPLDKKTEYSFTDIGKDPMELNPLQQWSVTGLAASVRTTHGDEAADWLIEAEAVGLWWASERKRLWNYKPSSS